VTASLSGVTGSDPFNVTAAAPAGVNVVTWHYDNAQRIEQQETSLSPGNVSAKGFGKLFSYWWMATRMRSRW